MAILLNLVKSVECVQTGARTLCFSTLDLGLDVVLIIQLIWWADVHLANVRWDEVLDATLQTSVTRLPSSLW